MERERALAEIEALCRELAGPIPAAERERGWTGESQRAMHDLLQRMLVDLRRDWTSGEKPAYRALIRGLDHWGIADGAWFDALVRISRTVGPTNLP